MGDWIYTEQKNIMTQLMINHHSVFLRRIIFERTVAQNAHTREVNNSRNKI